MSDLAELIIKDLNETMRKTLAPFIEKIEQTNKQYKTLVTLMSNMPEFKTIVEENMLLKEELQRQQPSQVSLQEPLQVSLQEPVQVPLQEPDSIVNTVTLEITPLTDTKIISFNVNEHVKQIYETINNEDASEIEDGAVSEEEEVEEDEPEEEEEVEEEVEEASEVDQEEEAEVEEEVEEDEPEEEEANKVDQEEEAEEEEEVEEDEADQSEEEAEEEEAEEEEEEAEEADQADEEAEEEVFTVEIDGVDYYTSDDVNGIIYSVDANEEVGEKVGQFVDGEPTFL